MTTQNIFDQSMEMLDALDNTSGSVPYLDQLNELLEYIQQNQGMVSGGVIQPLCGYLYGYTERKLDPYPSYQLCNIWDRLDNIDQYHKDKMRVVCDYHNNFRKSPHPNRIYYTFYSIIHKMNSLNLIRQREGKKYLHTTLHTTTQLNTVHNINESIIHSDEFRYDHKLKCWWSGRQNNSQIFLIII